MSYMNCIRGLGLGVATTALALAVQPALAGSTSELKERFAATEKAVNADDASAWADAMYADDVVIVGEGSEEAVRGLDALMPILNDIVHGSESCTISMNDAEINNGQAWSFATWSCTPATGDAYQVRALYVWEKQEEGWRVTAEMYGMGAMK